MALFGSKFFFKMGIMKSPNRPIMTWAVFGHKSYNYFFCLLQSTYKAWKQNFTGLGAVFKKLQSCEKLRLVFFRYLFIF